MKQIVTLLCLTMALFASANASTNSQNIPEMQVQETIRKLTELFGTEHAFRIERGVTQTAQLWREADGSENDFETFCKNNFIADPAKLDKLFASLERNFEVLNGYFHRIDLTLKEPIQLQGYMPDEIDMLFAGYDVSSHLNDDLYANKIAFITSLNFPFYSLKEKTELGQNWSEKQWAFARMGDQFISRVPAHIQQNISTTLTQADAYIADYNIYMGNLRNNAQKQLFASDMKLISHWGLRDELKSNYADAVNGLEKQRMIYKVMQRIIDQTIPQEIINSKQYTWNPINNKAFENNKEIKTTPELEKRYEVFLKTFLAMRQLDTYSQHYPTQIDRAFEQIMEIPQKNVEDLFVGLLTSPQVKEVAAFIEKRLGRPLEPFDIWYNGFKSSGGINEDELTAITSKKYPNALALENDLPNMLVKLGWKPDKAAQIASLITVDASRGAGHAWGASMRNDKAHLRTRVVENGMDYKGYNIAIHELGHNVEQTITMNDVNYYILNGVPNTSFTEAVAFLFQKRDMELLGLKHPDPHDEHYLALANFWACYEIMGVSLVDMKVWEWLYRNPNATPVQLKEKVLATVKEIWNQYYAGILGGKNETLLGIYSHMIDNPLYLPNYPMGHLIDFQIEQQVQGKNIADEIQRMYTQGRIIPQLWMKNAVGREISIEPLLNATSQALDTLNK